MNRRTLLAALLSAPALLPFATQARAATAQDQADIARIQAYLNGIETLKARFLQTAPDGAQTQGVAWLDRPGRMRLQYDPPSPLLLIANHGNVVFHDASLDQTSNIPVGNTPLGILLAEKVDLTATVTVLSIERLPGQIQITLTRTANPGEGQLTLIFAEDPLQLKSWVVTDSQRQQTRVSLFDVDLGGTFAPSLFEFATAPNPFAAPQKNN